MIKRRILTILSMSVLAVMLTVTAGSSQALNPNPPLSPVKLIFIHHSTGGNWLADPNNDQPYGGLGRALMDNNYFVSATNYGWGPDSIGDRTDIPNWPEWFTGPDSATYLAALHTESGQNIGDFGSWSRLATDPGGENEIIMFKSCFPNSDLYGNPDDPPEPEPNDQFTVGNAKAVYNNILTYFATRQDKLFIVITAPPLMESETAPERAANARAFNNWLVNDWLAGYPYNNVAVFDYYNVLTSNAGNANTNDAGAETGNHHRWWNGAVQHIQTVNNNYSTYPSGDSHPSTAGHQKATQEFVPLLNVFYNRWKESPAAPPPPPPKATEPPPPATPSAKPAQPPAETAPAAPPSPATGVVDDFESGTDHYTESDQATINIDLDTGTAHGGTASLRAQYDIAPGGWGGFGHVFEPPQDWSGGAGLSLWIHCEKAGQKFTLALFAGDPLSPTPFETHFETGPDCTTGWKQLVFSWAGFLRAEWVGPEGLSELDPARITSYGISITDVDGSQDTGTLWVDDIGLVTGEVPPPPPAEPEPAQTAAPVEEPKAPTEPAPSAVPDASTSETPSGGLCPAAMIALALGVMFALSVHLRNRL